MAGAARDDGEMHRIGQVPVGLEEAPQGGEVAPGDVDRAATDIAVEMVMVLVLGDVDDAGSAAEMDVMHQTLTLETLDGPIHGREVDRTTQLLLGTLLQVHGRHVGLELGGQDDADGPARSGDPHPGLT